MNTDISRQISADLLQIEAVFIRPEKPFTWASGLISPVYCDNRLIISYPEIRKRVCRGFCDLIRSKWPEVEVIAATATAGIPHGAWVAAELNLPFVYVRSGGGKAHGRGVQIEGVLPRDQKVVLIEDLISTGKSSLQAAALLREVPCELLGVASILTYGMDKATQQFSDAQTSWASLCTFATLVQVAVDSERIDAKWAERLLQWCRAPVNW